MKIFEASRRDFLLAASSQAAILTNASFAAAQEAKPSAPSADPRLNELTASLNLHDPKDLPRVVLYLWAARVQLTLATVEEAVEGRIQEIAVSVSQDLQERLKGDFSIEAKEAAVKSAVYFINIVISISVDVRSGAVHVVSDAIGRARAVCSRDHLFGYCK
jgi:hypothetical protein